MCFTILGYFIRFYNSRYARSARTSPILYYHAKAENDLARRDQLLDELRKLSSAYPDDGPTREPLAMGLFNTLYHAKAEKNYHLADLLMDELLAITPDLPQTEEATEILKKGIGNYGIGVLQAALADQNFIYGEQRLSHIENKIPDDWLEIIRLFKLALFAKRHGFDYALVKEPEEIRRVVKIILEQVENKGGKTALAYYE